MTFSSLNAARSSVASLALATAASLLVMPAAGAEQGPLSGPAPTNPMPRDSRPETATSSTASISGTVVSADARRPVRRAMVRLSPVDPGPPLRAVTDDAGRFTFDRVTAGRFTLSVSKPGYLDSLYGQRQPGSGRPGTELSVADGQRIDRLVLPLARGGVLAGTVSDDRGEPAFGTDVRAFRYVWQSGERTLRLMASDRADDRGGYRIGALPPGDYVVMATPPDDENRVFVGGLPGRPGETFNFTQRSGPSAPSLAVLGDGDVSEGYAPVYYPASRSSSGALVISLAVAEERAGLDIVTPFTPLGRVTGLVTGPEGTPSASEVRLIDVEDALGTPARTTIAGPDGAFSFGGVPPGQYRLEAHTGPQRRIIVDEVGGRTRVMMTATRSAGSGPPAPGPGGPFAALGTQGSERQYWAAADLYVSEHDTPTVLLQLEPGVTVTGRVAFDASGTPPEDPSGIRIVLNAASQRDAGVGSAIGQVAPDGTFTVTDVMPGRYRVSVLGMPSWRAKSFDVMGQDALDTLLEVVPDRHVSGAVLTLTARLAALSGTLREASGQPAPAYTVVLFAEDPAYWTPQSRRIHATRPGTDGQFSMAGLPSGQYRLAALEDVEDGRWFDPTLLEELAPLSIPVTLAEGETRVQDIQVAR